MKHRIALVFTFDADSSDEAYEHGDELVTSLEPGLPGNPTFEASIQRGTIDSWELGLITDPRQL